ncbi:MAG TPA: hypothetical protein VGN12_07055 [Pirellulales bacterium]|jgi:hypothetical protein
MRSLGAIARIMRRDIGSSLRLHVWTESRGDGRRVLVTSEDEAAAIVLAGIFERRTTSHLGDQRRPSLLTYRDVFRAILRRGRIAALYRGLASGEPELVQLSLWLIGRMRRRSAIREIIPFIAGHDTRTLREAARALRRLGAWAELRTIQEFDLDAKVRCFATPRTARSFDERFSRFAGASSRDASEALPSQRPFQINTGLPRSAQRSLRTPELIRAVLENIRRLVRGG